MLAKAASNASTSVLPQGTTYLLDKIGLAPGSFAKREAETYKGNTTDALIDTALFVGLTTLGGGVGRIVGAGVGKVVGNKFAEKTATEVGKRIRQEAGETKLGGQALNPVGARPKGEMPTNQAFPNLVNTVAEQAEDRARQLAQRYVQKATQAGANSGATAGTAVGAEAWKTVADNHVQQYGHSLGRDAAGQHDQPPQLSAQSPVQPTQDPPGLYTANGDFRTWDDLRAGALDTLGRTWGRGESVAGNMLNDFGQTQQAAAQQPEGPFSGSPGGSKPVSLLGVGRRPVPAQPQPTDGEVGQQNGDAPPPSGR